MDDSTKGWIVSLDYGMTALVALVSGQLQVEYIFTQGYTFWPWKIHTSNFLLSTILVEVG